MINLTVTSRTLSLIKAVQVMTTFMLVATFVAIVTAMGVGASAATVHALCNLGMSVLTFFLVAEKVAYGISPRAATETLLARDAVLLVVTFAVVVFDLVSLFHR